MREIKFNFIYGVDGKIETYFNKTFTFGEIEGGCHFDEISDSPLLKDYSILGKRQFTGLLDKNGKEIYEGDILFSSSWGNTPTARSRKLKYTHIAEWKNCGWVASGYNGDCKVSPPLDVRRDFEIIGNIYENPELLEAL